MNLTQADRALAAGFAGALPHALAGTCDQIIAGLTKLEQHSMHRVSTGFGIDHGTRVVCTCGWRGEPRAQADDSQCANLAADERGHFNSVRGLA